MTIVPWQESLDGNFARAFVASCLPDNGFPHPPPQSVESPKRNSYSDIEVPFGIRQVLVDIVLAWAHNDAGGVILKSEVGKQIIFQAIEFISPHKQIEEGTFSSEPIVLVSYAKSTSLQRIKKLLRDERVVVITCPGYIATYLARHFESSSSNCRLVDFVSGLTLREGFIRPNLKQSSRRISSREVDKKDIVMLECIDESDSQCDNCNFLETRDSFDFEKAKDAITYIGARCDLDKDIKSTPPASIWTSFTFAFIIACLLGILYVFYSGIAELNLVNKLVWKCNSGTMDELDTVNELISMHYSSFANKVHHIFSKYYSVLPTKFHLSVVITEQFHQLYHWLIELAEQ